jgi:hypothetical protein
MKKKFDLFMKYCGSGIATEMCMLMVLLYNDGFGTTASKTALAHIVAFPNKCTIKHHLFTKRLYEKSGNL